MNVCLLPRHLRQILREGLAITGWVGMWRALKVPPHGWWPMVDERGQIRRILAALSIRNEGIAQSPTSEVASPRSQRDGPAVVTWPTASQTT